MKIDPIQALLEYASYASVSTDPNYQIGMEKARKFVIDQLTSIGFDIEVIETPLHPLILASRIKNPDWPHIMFYAHYDVQPADPFELWKSKPFEPELRDRYFFGRGVTDNKGPFIVQLTALAQVLEKNPDIPLNFTFLIEGEEEIGSPSFPAFLEKYKERLKQADVLIISDTTSPNPKQVVITTSLRGIIGLDIEITGPKSDLHSGLYGGPIYNPIQALTEICASLHDGHGNVNVPGFYETVSLPEDWERDELKKYPVNERELQSFLEVPGFHVPKGYTALESIRFAPTLEFNGIGGGYQGQGSKTIIPSKAFAKITCRLVANQDPDDIRKKVTEAIKERVPKGVQVKIKQLDGGEPYLVIPPHKSNSPKPYPKILQEVFDATEKSVTEIFGTPPLYLREGGSIPIIGKIKKVTGIDSILIGLALSTDNMHAPNESFSLEMMEKAIKMYQKILEECATKLRSE